MFIFQIEIICNDMELGTDFTLLFIRESIADEEVGLQNIEWLHVKIVFGKNSASFTLSPKMQNLIYGQDLAV